MLQFLIGRRAGHEEAISIPNGQTTHEARTGNAAVDHWNHISQLGIKGAVEVGAATDGDEAVGVCQTAEDTDFRRVLKGDADRHDDGVMTNVML